MNITAMSITQESAQQQKSFSHYVSELEPHKLFPVNQHGEPTSGMVMVLAGSDAHQLNADTLGLSQKPASSLTEEDILCGSTHQNDHIPRLSEIDDIAEFKGVAGAWIEQWPTTKLKGNFALINQIVYHWANCWGAVEKVWETTEFGQKQVSIGCDRDIVQEKLGVPALLNTSVSSTVDSIKRFYGKVGTPSSRSTVKRYTADLREAGLLDYDSSFQSTGRARNRFYTFLDIPRLLILAELLIERIQFLELPMPSHWGRFVGWLYDAVFTGWGWRKNGYADDQEPETVEESVEARAVASHESRAEIEERSPHSISFRSALRHLNTLVDTWERVGGSHIWWKLAQARRWAVSRCRNDLDRQAVAQVCPIGVKRFRALDVHRGAKHEAFYDRRE